MLLTLDLVSASTPEQDILFTRLSISIAHERVGVVGRNGSEKSTLLRIVAGTLVPAAGTVQRFGTIGTLAQEWGGQQTGAQAIGVAADWAVVQRVLRGEGRDRDFSAAD